jgi:hypothetical protein
VTSGIGTSGVRLRWRVPPEFVVLERRGRISEETPPLAAGGFTGFPFMERSGGFPAVCISSSCVQPTTIDHRPLFTAQGVNDDKIFAGACRLGTDRTLKPIIFRVSSTENGESLPTGMACQ